MTRTARAAYPRAVIKDRSESRTGLDSSIRKSGAGHHNWGSIADELQLETAAIDDEEMETEISHVPISASLIDSSSTRCRYPPSFFLLTHTHSFSQPFHLRGHLSSKCSLKKRWRRLATSGRMPSRVVRHLFLCIFISQLTPITVIDLTAIARTSSAVSATPPVSPITIRRDGHDNKQIPIHVSLHYLHKNRVTHYASSQSV